MRFKVFLVFFVVGPAVANIAGASLLCSVATSVSVDGNDVLLGTARGAIFKYQGRSGQLVVDGCGADADWRRLQQALPAITKLKSTAQGYFALSHQEGIWNSRSNEGFIPERHKYESAQALLDVLLLDSSSENDMPTALAVGTRGLFLARSADGDWQRRDLYIDPEWEEPDDFTLYGITQLADERFITVGEAGVIYRSENGKDWLKESAGTESSWFGVVALPSGGVLLYGFGGNLAFKTDIDADWQLAQTGSSKSLFASVLLADGTVLLAGAGGELLHWSGMRAINTIQTGTIADISDIDLHQDQLLMATDSGLLSVPWSQ